MSESKHTEEWRDVPGFEGLYQVSSIGRVKSVGRVITYGQNCRQRSFCKYVKERILTFVIRSGSYKYVSLCRNGVVCTHGVHRLVLMAFVGPCPEDMEACHFPDRDPGNNRLGNLRWGTKKDNAADMLLHGTSCKGRKMSSARRAIISVSKRGKKMSDEGRAKLSAARKLAWETNPELQKRFCGWSGRKHSDESKRKMSEARRMFWERKRHESK